MAENPDLEALEWVLSQVVHHGMPTGISDTEYGDNMGKLNRVQALIERVKKANPIEQASAVMLKNGWFVLAEMSRVGIAEDMDFHPDELPSNQEIDEIIGDVAESYSDVLSTIMDEVRESVNQRIKGTKS